MKLIIIHGTLEDLMLKKILEIKKEFDSLSVSEFAGTASSLSFSSQSLFSKKRLIIISDPDLETVKKALIQKDEELTIILKFLKTLEKSSAIFKVVYPAKPLILEFSESSQKNIFPFLDMLGNLNNRSFAEFEKNYNEFGGQYLLSMIAYFLRRMVVNNSSSEFMRQKIKTQRRNFSISKISALYREVIESDFKIKQGLIEEKMALTLLVQKVLRLV